MSRRRKPNRGNPARTAIHAERAATVNELRFALVLLGDHLARHPNPGLLAWADQQAAASRDRTAQQANAVATTVGQPFDDVRGTDPVKVIAVLTAAYRARPPLARCPHVDGLDTTVPTTWNVSVRLFYCDACGPRGCARDGVVLLAGDQLCDLCNQPPPSAWFTPIVVTLGTVTALYEAGTCCVEATNPDNS